TSKVAEKKFSQIDIDRTHSQDNGIRVYQYILNRSKIIAKLRELVSNIKEFSDAPQTDLSESETAEVSAFKVPELTLETLVTPKPADATSTGEVRNSTSKPSQPINPTVMNSEIKAEVKPSQIADDSIREVMLL